MWMKWRHKFAYGPGDWEWRELDSTYASPKEAANAECEELSNAYEWSDKYRGIDFKLHAHPPVEVIEALIEEAKRTRASWGKRTKKLQALLTTVKGTR